MKDIWNSKSLVFGSYVLICLLTVVFLQRGRSFAAAQSESLKLYPQTYDRMPPVSSPYVMKDGTEIVVAFIKGKKFACFPVTQENGSPLNYARADWQMGKGKQLDVDGEDFPTLAETGLHSEIELDQTKSITGRSVVSITDIGHPDRSSGSGFMAHDEDIISVLKGDNRLVRKLGLTHRQTAKVLFHVWNFVYLPYKEIEYLVYNGRKIFLEIQGSRGWQDSIFKDEILGNHTVKIRRSLEPEEKEYLKNKYPHLNDEKLARLSEGLSVIATGEMPFYYIVRYGFYEGHTDYRVDPMAVAFIFGLRSLEFIDGAMEGKLDEALEGHFTRESFLGGSGNE